METTATQIGPYTLLSEIARGGTGVVYLAARTADFNKRVALKILKRGMDTSAVLERFHRERQILARLENPRIARLLDGGATPGGLPFLVMECVDGQPITAFCGANHLSIEGRLRLFLDVCEGVLYAHRSLVIHRDLKPGNILVTKDGQVKLLDFGIAKLLDPEAAASLSSTIAGLAPFTPEYASPEQVQGRTATILTDVYSLGAVLYELLTGQSPHQFSSRSAAEIERVICEKEPKPPSLIATGTEIPRDLEAIVLTALQKDPVHRYASVEQFAADVRCFLAGQPVAAHSGSRLYRLRKFLLRHRGAVLAVATALAGVLAGTVLAVRHTHLARRNAAIAEQRFNQVRKLASTMLFDHDARIRTLPGATKAREAIVQSAQQYLDSLAAEAANDTTLRLELAEAYQRLGAVQGLPGSANLGRPEDAIRSFAKAQALLDPLPLEDPKVLRLAINNLRVVSIYERSGKEDEVRKLRLKRLELAERLYNIDRNQNDAWYGLIFALQGVAVANIDAGHPQEALPTLRRALALCEEWRRNNPSTRSDSALAVLYSAIARAMRALGDVRQAIAYGQKELEIRELTLRRQPTHAPYWRNAFHAHWFLGTDFAHPVSLSLGAISQAANHCNQAIAWARKSHDADPANEQAKIDLAFAHRCLGAVHLLHDPARAIPEYRQSLAITQPLLLSRPESIRYLDDAANSWWGLASALRLSRRFADAEEPYLITLRMFEKVRSVSKGQSYLEQLAYTHAEYAMLRHHRNDSTAASTHIEQAIQLARSAVRDYPSLQSQVDLARILEMRSQLLPHARCDSLRESASIWHSLAGSIYPQASKETARVEKALASCPPR